MSARRVERPLPRSFDLVVVFIVTQAHLVSALVVLTSAEDFRSLPPALALVACSLAVPLACVAVARRRGGGDLPLPVFVAAGAALVALDLAVPVTMRPDRVGAPSMWSAVAVGVTLLALCPYRPPRDLVALAAVHAAAVGAVLALHRDAPAVEPFVVVVQLSAAVVPAVAAAEYVRFYVHAVRRRQEAVAEQTRSQARVAAAAAIREDADRRIARLRTEVLPLLDDVAAGRRAVDDPDGARLATRLSADLRRELVEARSGAWLLSAPALLPGAAPSGDPAGAASGGGRVAWPGVLLLDPERLVGRLHDRDRAALSAVLAALRATGGWTRVSVVLSVTYGLDGPGAPGPGGGATAFVTVVAHAALAVASVDPAVAASAAAAGCSACIEPPSTCVVDGTVRLRPGDHA